MTRVPSLSVLYLECEHDRWAVSRAVWLVDLAAVRSTVYLVSLWRRRDGVPSTVSQAAPAYSRVLGRSRQTPPPPPPPFAGL